MEGVWPRRPRQLRKQPLEDNHNSLNHGSHSHYRGGSYRHRSTPPTTRVTGKLKPSPSGPPRRHASGQHGGIERERQKFFVGAENLDPSLQAAEQGALKGRAKASDPTSNVGALTGRGTAVESVAGGFGIIKTSGERETAVQQPPKVQQEVRVRFFLSLSRLCDSYIQQTVLLSLSLSAGDLCYA